MHQTASDVYSIKGQGQQLANLIFGKTVDYYFYRLLEVILLYTKTTVYKA